VAREPRSAEPMPQTNLVPPASIAPKSVMMAPGEMVRKVAMVQARSRRAAPG
jgi:hypothetical protein